GVDAFLGQDIELRQTDRVPGGVEADGGAGLVVGPGGGAQHPLLLGGDVVQAADLADDAGADVGAVDALSQVVDQLVGQVIDGPPVHLGRVVRLAVPAAAHHHVEAGRLGDLAQGRGVAR